VDLTMVPLEVTHTALVTPDVLSRLITGDDSMAQASSSGSSSSSGSPRRRRPSGEFTLPKAAENPYTSSDEEEIAAEEAAAPLCVESSSSSGDVDSSVMDEVTAGVTASPFKLLMEQLLTYFASTYRRQFGFQDPPLHDPCAVAYAICPGIFQVGGCHTFGGRGVTPARCSRQGCSPGVSCCGAGT
jgi:hypothetical protein